MRTEINVTPLVDVMLVLLVIFMVVTPLTQKGHDVELPGTSEASRPLETPGHPLVLEADDGGRVTLNRQPIAPELLGTTLREVFEARADKSLFFRGHRKLRYGEVVAILDVAKASGVDRVGILPD